MLKSIIDSGATLIDYECISDESGRRLIFFGRFAGLAGMINTLWSAGERYREIGISNPFENIKQSYTYSSLDDAITVIRNAGKRIEKNGLPEQMDPLIIAVTGDGNVSNGAIEILKELPVHELSIEAIIKRDYSEKHSIQWCNILPEHYLTRADGLPFDLIHYFENPTEYKSHIEDFLPDINVFVNGIYWDERYPRLITKEWLNRKFRNDELNLKVIGDMSCDTFYNCVQ